MINIQEYTKLVSDRLLAREMQLCNVSIMLTEAGVLDIHIKFHVGNGTKTWCKYYTADERHALRKGTVVDSIQEFMAHVEKL